MYQYKRWVIFTAALFLAIAAALINGSHLYYMAAILLVLPWISYVLGMLALRDLTFTRETPGTGWEGEVTTFHVVVQSRARLPRLFLRAVDQSHEWLRHLDAEAPLFNAAPRQVTRVPYQVSLEKRGAYTIEWMRVTALDPLGIFSFTRRVPARSEILVYPVPQPIAELALSGAERYGVRDLPVAAARGSGVDPDGVREYVPGDPLRRVHWKLTARTGKLNVIEFEEARAVNVALVLDLHQGTNVGRGKETTLEYQVRAAASIAQTSVRQGASVRLVMGDDPDAAAAPGRGTEHLFTILGALARAEAHDPELLSARLTARVGLLQPGSSLLILTSCLDTALPGALSHYTSTGAQVLVLYVDPRSFDPAVRLPTRTAQRALMEGLLTAQVMPYWIQHDAQGRLQPEHVQNVGNLRDE